MQIVRDVTFIQLPWMPSRTKVLRYAFLAIDKMYQIAYEGRHVPGSFSRRVHDAENSFTPNEMRLRDLLIQIMLSEHDFCVVHCGDQSFGFGLHDEHAACAHFKYEHAVFIE